MKDLYHAIDALNNIIKEAPVVDRTGKPVMSKSGPVQAPGPAGKAANPAAPKPAPAAPRPAAVSPTPGVGRQDGPGLPKPAAPKINPAVPAAGPVRANPINPQAMAATKAAASVVNAPKPAPAPKPVAAPAPRAKVKATAANTKDYDKTVALQKKLGVTADGIMGPQTRAAMAAAAAKKPATPASQVTPTAGDPGMQQSASPAPTGTARKVSTVAPGAKPAAADDMMSPDDMMMQPARVAKSNAALAGDVEKAKKAGSGILDKIGAGISSLFKPSERSVIGRRQAAAQAAPSGDFNFDDPKQNANAGGRLQTSRLAAPAAGSNAAGSNFATAADGSISRTDNPRQPNDATPTTRTATAPKGRMARNRLRQQQRVAAARNQARDIASGAATAPVARDSGPEFAPVRGNTTPERGTVPGQGAGERTVSVGGQQVRGAEADRAINVAQAGADNARLRMGAARAGLSVKDYAAQQNRLNQQAGDRMMKTAKASDAGVY